MCRPLYCSRTSHSGRKERRERRSKMKRTIFILAFVAIASGQIKTATIKPDPDTRAVETPEHVQARESYESILQQLPARRPVESQQLCRRAIVFRFDWRPDDQATPG